MFLNRFYVSCAGGDASFWAPGLTPRCLRSIAVCQPAYSMFVPPWRCINSFVFYILVILIAFWCCNTVSHESIDSCLLHVCPCPVELWLWYFCVSLQLMLSLLAMSRAFIAGAASQSGDTDFSWAPGPTSGFERSTNFNRITTWHLPQWVCIITFVHIFFTFFTWLNRIQKV